MLLKPQTAYKLFLLLALSSSSAYSACEKSPQEVSPILSPEKIYDGFPFLKGEVLRMKVSYFGLKAGHLQFRVLDPVFVKDQWLMQLESTAITGEWYEKIFKARDSGTAFLHPQNFFPAEFRTIQNHVPLIGRNYNEDKLLHFDFQNCDVTEEYRNKEGVLTKTKHAELEPDSIDILGAFYKLRTIDFTKEKEARFKVYTSEKNWWLTATREEFVQLTVPTGKFDAVRLKLQTYIGKELQQKGNVLIWIAIHHPQHPVLKIEADIRIGSFVAVLDEFKEGTGVNLPAVPVEKAKTVNPPAGKVSLPAKEH